MIAWDVFERRDGKLVPLRFNGERANIGVEYADAVSIVFAFVDESTGTPLPEIEAEYDLAEYAVDGGNPKRVLRALGRKLADRGGRMEFVIPLPQASPLCILFDAVFRHGGVGAYPDMRESLDIRVRRVYDENQGECSLTAASRGIREEAVPGFGGAPQDAARGK